MGVLFPGAPLTIDLGLRLFVGAFFLGFGGVQQRRLPGVLMRPAKQGEHEPAPGSCWNVPEGQGVQTEPPVTALMVPGAQGVHCPSPLKAVIEPMGHIEQAVLPRMKLYEPGAHCEQLDDALVLDAVPAGQLAQRRRPAEPA